MNTLYWTAGLLEGEGSFAWRNSYSAKISCGMTDMDVIQRLQDHWGGNINKQTYKAKPHYKDVYVWVLSGDAAISLMLQLLPLMGERRSERIREVLQSHKNHQAAMLERRGDMVSRATSAAREYLEGGGSLRDMSAKHGVSYVTVKNYADRLTGEATAG